MEKQEKKIALLSVYDKKGIVEFANELVGLGWTILSSGGTAKKLKEAGIDVMEVADLVGGGAILGHRVVTLSRQVHAGLLAQYTPEDAEEMKMLGIPYIDLVCVDMYPLEEEIAKPNATRQSVTEQTDIGGPTMIRSGEKGRRIVICDPEDRKLVIDWLKLGRPDEENFISALCAKAEGVVANYCLHSARYQSDGRIDGMIGYQTLTCKYGENAWQTPAGLFSTGTDDPLAINNFKLIEGTSPSYNNVCDIDRMLQTVTHIAAGFDQNGLVVPLIAVAVKHGNPCGAAVSFTDTAEALGKMISGDTKAIFGGLVMTNFPVDEDVAEILMGDLMPHGKRRLLDGIIAPSFSDEAIEMLKRKGDKCRLIENSSLLTLRKNSLDTANRFRPVRGGFLRQPNYAYVLDFADPRLQQYGELTPEQRNGMILAWAVGSTSNSNTVTLVHDQMLIGNGVGQQDRVGGCKLAVARAKDAGHETGGSVAYSDSFFPFIDGPEKLHENGVSAIFTSSGSVRDPEVIEFCKAKGITLYMIPDAVGRGFFGH